MGHLGTKQLGAVSLASLATSLATYVFSFLVFLTTPRVAAAHANSDSKTVARLAAVGLWLALGTGLLVAVTLSFSAGAIVHGGFGFFDFVYAVSQQTNMSNCGVSLTARASSFHQTVQR
jgi:hypothetical protein